MVLLYNIVAPLSSANSENNNNNSNNKDKGQNRSTKTINKQIHAGKTVSSKQGSKGLTSENIQFLQLLCFKVIA
ncbi:unnamed protein product [Acanthoscelides obtectus]|uniref:Uncharacterized protein n=1 Tax=Acanthoscelides obtectus TaxID=200917 RepID=A0A9P0MG84_ACAOB|nr:unnamed protein product [Acanthoscelides obtectus]CAK1624323.1 hypothetical protein AOBTE_LOCUS2496 [Acanthoscelides obtectus]